MFKSPLRQFPRAFIESLNRQRLFLAIEPHSSRLLERVHVKVRDMAPNHLAAEHVSLSAHRLPPRLVAEEAADLLGNRAGIAKRHKSATAVGQQFLGMPIGRGDDRLSAAKGVSQRTRRNLRRL